MKQLSLGHTSQSALDPIFLWIFSHYLGSISWPYFQVHILYIFHYGLPIAMVYLKLCSLLLGELCNLNELVFSAIAHPYLKSHGLGIGLVECSVDTSSLLSYQLLWRYPCLSSSAKQVIFHLKMLLYIPCLLKLRWKQDFFSYQVHRTHHLSVEYH